uniref:HAUS augmin-like complex, subunit 2 n=1 Tax=Nothobranchius pienaari TaxID=704102 RepID=A0A1A8L7W5_9TELE
MWEPSLFSVTPAASLLSRCVSVGAVSQDEIDAAFSSPNPVFSTRLQETEEMIRNQKQLDELQLELELLKMEERSADVSHDFHLDQKNKRLQQFACHLLDLLREQRILRQRLMRPLARTNLPVPAHMQSFMVGSVELMMDFVACLEEKLKSAQIQTTTADSLTLLVSYINRLFSDYLNNRYIKCEGLCSEFVGVQKGCHRAQYWDPS